MKLPLITTCGKTASMPKVTSENAAWLTNRGVLVLPTSGYSYGTGQYEKNTPSEADMFYLKAK